MLKMFASLAIAALLLGAPAAAADEAREEAEVTISPFGLGGGGPFFSALLINPAGPNAEFGMLYGGKGFTYPTSWLRLSGIGFGGGFGYGKQVGGGFGMGGLALELIARDGKRVEFPVGIAVCFGGGDQTIEVTDEETGESRKVTEGGFIFMPLPSFGVEFNPAPFVKIGLTTQFLYAVADPEDYWGFGASLWLAFGQVWPAAS